MKMNDFLNKLYSYFPHETLNFEYNGNKLTGISIDFTKTKKSQNLGYEVFSVLFDGLKKYDVSLYELKILLNYRTRYENIFEILESYLPKIQSLRILKLKFWMVLMFISKVFNQNLCNGIKSLQNLEEISLDFSEMNLHYDNLSNLGKNLSFLPNLMNIGLGLNKSNTTIGMICEFNSHFLLNKNISIYQLNFKENNLREIGLKRLLKSIEICFPELKSLYLDLSINCLRKESFIYCIRKCLKKKCWEKLEDLRLQFIANETKIKNYLTIETSQEIMRQELEKITIEKYFKPIKILMIDFNNNEFMIEDFLFFTKIFQYLSNTEIISLDFRQNNQIYDSVLLIKLLQKMLTINNSLRELQIKFERLEIVETEDCNIPFFENLRKFEFETNSVKFGKKRIEFNSNELCFIIEKMLYLKELRMKILFYEYNHYFFHDFFHTLLKLTKLKYLSLDLNYLYLFPSQCEILINSLKMLKKLRQLELFLTLKCEINKIDDHLEESDYENLIYLYENLPLVCQSIQKLIYLKAICIINGEEHEDVLEYDPAKQILMNCLKNRKNFLRIEISNKKLKENMRKIINKYLFMSKIIEFKLKSIFKRNLIRNEILEKFM